MKAIEFQTQVRDGHIELPEEFKAELTGPVRVIVLTEEASSKRDALAELMANPIKVENFKPLTREEIYEGCALTANATLLYTEDMDTSLTVAGRLRIANPLVH